MPSISRPYLVENILVQALCYIVKVVYILFIGSMFDRKLILNLENESQPECPPLLTDINIYIQGCEQEAILKPNFCEQYRGAKRRPKNHLIIAKCINILYIAMVFCNLYCMHTYVYNYTFNFANCLNVSMCTSELRRDFY